ncbi:MFS transporter [Geodermatophilus sp. SYSU D00779]
MPTGAGLPAGLLATRRRRAGVSGGPAVSAPDAERVPPWALIGSGLAVVAVAFGLARYGYGLLLPQMRTSLELSWGQLGVIGGTGYGSYLVASLACPALLSRSGPRATVMAGGTAAVVGMAVCAAATGPLTLGVGVAVAGASPALVWPPYVAAVEEHLPADRRARGHGVVNSGTAYGVALAGPVSLLATGSWRVAWSAFAAVALLVTIWAVRTLPHGIQRTDGATGARSLVGVAREQGGRLLLAAFLAGVVAGSYATFGVEVATAQAPLGEVSGGVFQTLVGISGVAGGLVGALLARTSLPRLLTATAWTLAASCLLLAAAPGLVLVSAVLYGAGFIAILGLLLIWSNALVPRAPATGIVTAMLAMSLGLVVGPPLAGAVAGAAGLAAVFVACAPLAATIGLLHPARRSSATARPA